MIICVGKSAPHYTLEALRPLPVDGSIAITTIVNIRSAPDIFSPFGHLTPFPIDPGCLRSIIKHSMVVELPTI